MKFTIPSSTKTPNLSRGCTEDLNKLYSAVTIISGCNVLNTAYSGGADETESADSTDAFNACRDDAVSTGRPMVIPAGTYKITETLDWKIPGLVVHTAGTENTKIVQHTDNIPIVQVAGSNQDLGGLTLSYSSQQAAANTGAIGITFGDDTVGSCFMSQFRGLSVLLSQTGLAIDPSVASLAGLFSCEFGTIHVLGYSYSAIRLKGGNGVGAHATGCVFSNIYTHNNYSGSDVNSTYWPVYFEDWDELVINELNIEHADVFSSDALAFVSVGNAVVSGLHFEHLELSGPSPGTGFVYISHDSTVIINGMTIRYPTMTGATLNSIVRMNGDSPHLVLNGLHEPNDGGVASVHPLVDFGSATNARATVDGISVSQITDDYANGDATCSLKVQDGAIVRYSPPLAWTTFATGGSANLLNPSSGTSATPTAGTWYYADLYIPFTTKLTGIIPSAPVGPNSGSDKWMCAIWPAAGGTKLANSSTSGLTVPGSGTTAEDFKIAFTAPVTLPGPAVYKVAIQSNGTAARFEAFSNGVEGFVTGSQAGTFGTVPTLSPGSSYTQNVGPMIKTY